MSGEAVIVGGLIELAKMGLVVWMQASQMANLSEAQREAIFQEVKMKFDMKDPKLLPDV